ncbi:hypothetical protein [Corynebacterium auriscanis]|uniref:hypothetical protein n=1 Tax=Corynebacterium auriscanis TaxID=99807 RepID=UPI0012ECA46F|nr:hypothetical protein [Corynebacterium auriscanis]WJY71722.1 hypothetical protein CAURIC_00175 [Corynebacterium auriscanis]
MNTDKPSKLRKLRDGSIHIVSSRENLGTVVRGIIDEPWAVDAKGKMLPTTYSIDGNKIIQRIDTKGASYPIVADPKVTWGRGMYINFWGQELNVLGSAAGIALGILGASGCAAVGVTKKIPNLPKAIIGFLCSVGGSQLAKDMIRASMRNNSFRAGQCYQVRYPSDGKRWNPVGKENCN